jgi:hypothetical protein
MVRKTARALVACCLLSTGLQAGERCPVVSEFHLAASFCQNHMTGRSDLHFQVVVLRLNKGAIYLAEEGAVRLTGSRAGKTGARYRHQMMLEQGEYLLEFLWYSEKENRYELLARHLTVDKPLRSESLTLSFDLEGLSCGEFQKYRRSLVYNPARRDKSFMDHMLWYAVQNNSLRPPEDQVELFARLKTLSAYINYAPATAGRGLGMSRDAASLRGVSGFIVAEAYFKIAVRTDNLRELLETWDPAGDDLAPRDLATLRQVSEEARQIVREGRFLGLPTSASAPPDEAPDGSLHLENDPAAQKERLKTLADYLEEAVKDTFFNADKSVALDRFRNPLDIADRLDAVAQQAMKLHQR